ncbi:MAG TPA: 2-oxo acid dehydrogenase subunit E2 [Solirubrobacteraceae bacterium]|jgi:pyruvate dehydrogenase E2 component (dihydrolipoamide acetyltransferase)|nr:2-oxo acid dehydrogenase subunit E2 [Solirubrobacteraceae bacterium]
MDPPIDISVATTAKGEGRIEEPTRAERVIARRVAESRATVPDIELAVIVDMSAMVDARGGLRAADGSSEAPSLTAVIVRAAALALREHPRANGAYRDGKFELYSRVNVGVVMTAGDAFLVPTVSDADVKTALAIDAELRAVAASVRAGTITPPELAGATFTVYDLGALGVSNFSPPVLPPQAAILAVGAVREVPVVRDGDMVVGHEMNLTLACDHRILHGPQAAGFLTRIENLLEAPAELLG